MSLEATGPSLDRFTNWSNSFDGDGTRYLDDSGSFSVPSGGGGGLSYAVYTSLLSQVDMDAPIAVILQNTLSGTPVLSRVSAGTYALTLTGAFPLAKTWYSKSMVLSTGVGTVGVAILLRDSDDTILLFTTGTDGNPTDGMLFPTEPLPIEIRVYP